MTAENMACKFCCYERGKSSMVIANENWTEAEPKPDSHVRSLMNVAEFKANSMDKL